MAEVTPSAGHVVSRIVVGLVYVAAGMLLIIAEAQDVQLQWSVVGPLALVLLGIGLLVTALLDTRLRDRVPSP